MTSLKFTPGPWYADPSDKILRQWGVGKDLYWGSVAIGVDPLAIIVRDGIEAKEAKANAHLIAAAPELYAFVEAFITWYEDDASSVSDARTLFGHALLIGAKARGEQP